MLRATWRSVFARKLRLFLSAFAVILGVAFVAGSYIFTDTLDRAFTGLTSGAVGDVIVTPGEAGEGGGIGPAPPGCARCRATSSRSSPRCPAPPAPTAGSRTSAPSS